LTAKTYLKNKTAQETFILYSAIIFNILLGWILTKLNTQYLTVNEYGQYALIITVMYYSQSFFSFGAFESTSRLLALVNDEKIKRQLFGASFTGAVILFIPLTISLSLFSLISDSLFEVKIGSLILNFSLFAGLVILHSFFMITLRGSGDISKLSFVIFSPRAIYVLILGYFILVNRFTIVNSLFSMFLALFLTMILIWISIRPLFNSLNHSINEIIKETKQYGINIYIGNLLHETLKHSDKLLISYFIDAESLAYYGLAYMITYPLSHFSNSLATTLFNKFASQNRINKKVLIINFLYIIITVLIFIFLRELIVTYLFSSKYITAIGVMLPLAMAFGFSGLCKPYTLYLMARGQGKKVRNISIIILILNIIMNVYLIPRFGIIGAGWATFIAYGLDFFLYWYYYNQYQSKSFK
jgi:O-antigen/teichoic acid export membrane protein